MSRSKFDRYYNKNVNFAKIPSWNLLCVKYNKFNIARFYDKDIKRKLKDKISIFIKEKKDRNCKNCKVKFKHIRNCNLTENCKFKPYKDKKLIKLILVEFINKYGRPLIFDSLYELKKENRLEIKEKNIQKSLSFFSCEKKGNF